ncbi:MAG: dinitrogenase iron-molybdenum cofactor biosynthesis protein [Bacteroidetes bacterium]|nr:dinitrogenase iron-molybdenum cofactor biosynthesis protein [Bacteroidota bacterium]
MKIAVPTRGTNVDEHFGHCEYYTIFSINEKQAIEKTELLPSPQGCGCKSNIASVLRQMGVETLLAGNMGEGAVNVLQHHGITVYRGCSGDVTTVTELFLKGKVADSGESCHSHEEGHQCSH